jgi:hypothetical protein
MLKNSEVDNYIHLLDDTYIENAIFKLIKLDLVNLVKIKAAMAKNFHIQPSEIDNMLMWEYELFIQYINDSVKEENDMQQKEMSKYNIGDYKKMSNPKSMSKMTPPKMPPMPSIPK